MKILMYLATVTTTTIALLAPGLVRAQAVYVEPFPSSGYSSTIIYVSPTASDSGFTTNETTTYERVNTNIYPQNSSFGSSTTTTDGNNGKFRRNYRPYPGRTVILKPQYIYPRSGRSVCSMSIVGSPIPSPIPLDNNGQPCR
jgi:hypothetical protein